MPIPGGPALRQPTFDWKAEDKYQKPCIFKIGVKNIFMTKHHNSQESKRVQIIISWPGQKGLRFMQTPNNEKQKKYRTSIGLFEV